MVVWPDRHAGTFGSERLDAAAVSDVRGQLAVGQTGQLRYGPDGARQTEDLPRVRGPGSRADRESRRSPRPPDLLA
jgi:XdhC/CoxI family protein